MLKMSIHNGLVVSYDDPELRPEGKKMGWGRCYIPQNTKLRKFPHVFCDGLTIEVTVDKQKSERDLKLEENNF